MFGHVAERQHPSRWLIPSFLFAVALAWSFAVTEVRDDSGRSFLMLATAVAVGLSALRVGPMLMSFRRRKRARKGEEAAETDTSDGSPTEERRPTYGELFGAEGTEQAPEATLEPGEHVDAELDAPAEQDAWADDGFEATAGDHGESVDAEPDGTAEHADWMGGDVGTSEGQDPSVDGDLDATNDEIETIQADLEAQEALRRMREEFRARAKEAELRVRQREAELEDAPTGQTAP